MKIDLLKKISEIELFLFDLEGVLVPKNFESSADNTIKFLSELKEAAELFLHMNSRFGIVTASRDPIVEKIKSCKKCLIFSNSLNKVKQVDEFLKAEAIDYKNVLYIGDDILDIPLLQKVGLPGAPKDGRREVKRVVSFTTKANSGEVLKEIIDFLKQTKK